MEKIIQDKPNDVVAILCNIKKIDEKRNSFAIIPLEVAVGKIDSNNSFVREDLQGDYKPVEEADITNIDEEKVFYCYPTTFTELQEKYRGLSDTLLATSYLSELRDKIVLLYKNNANGKLIVESVPRKDEASLINSAPQTKTQPNNNYAKPIGGRVIRAELYGYLKERVINNDSVLDDISTIICDNLDARNPKNVEKMLCIGGTGSGKTETVRQLKSYLGDVPVTIFDCDSLTAEGYVGDSISDICSQIFANANGDMALAERSIICLDEVDKLASRGNSVTDIAAQQSLLKFVEGGQFQFKVKEGGSKIIMDTSFLTVIATGAFDGMLNSKNPIGYSSNSSKKEIDTAELNDKIIKFGFLPEFVGRFHHKFMYKDIDRKGLEQILTQSKISRLVIEKEFFKEMYDCDMSWDDSFVQAIVDHAIASTVGARSINEVLSGSLVKARAKFRDERDMGHELPSSIVLNKDIIDNPSKFKIR